MNWIPYPLPATAPAPLGSRHKTWCPFRPPLTPAQLYLTLKRSEWPASPYSQMVRPYSQWTYTLLISKPANDVPPFELPPPFVPAPALPALQPLQPAPQPAQDQVPQVYPRRTTRVAALPCSRATRSVPHHTNPTGRNGRGTCRREFRPSLPEGHNNPPAASGGSQERPEEMEASLRAMGNPPIRQPSFSPVNSWALDGTAPPEVRGRDPASLPENCEHPSCTILVAADLLSCLSQGTGNPHGELSRQRGA